MGTLEIMGARERKRKNNEKNEELKLHQKI